jgi:hypothetical protein
MTTNPEGLREQIALWFVRMECDHETLDWPESKCREILAAVKEEHSGDCKKQPWTCMRCVAEDCYRYADAIISGPLQARVEELEGAVRIAAVAFRQYEALHLAKGTQDGDEKAQRNHELAARMEAALSHKEGEGNV